MCKEMDGIKDVCRSLPVMMKAGFIIPNYYGENTEAITVVEVLYR
jgi:hypothetical protein